MNNYEKKGVRKGLVVVGVVAFFSFSYLLAVGKVTWSLQPLQNLLTLQLPVADSKNKKDQSKTSETEIQGSLDSFYRLLEGLEKKRLNRPVRMAFFTTSGNGFDRVSSVMREKLQKRFGDGGKGFLPVSKGWKYHRHQDVQWEYSQDWKTFSVTYGKHPKGHYGLGGVNSYNKKVVRSVFETVNADSKKGFVPGTKFSRFKLYYEKGPGRGHVELTFDDKIHKKITTQASRRQTAVFSHKLEDGPHKVELVTSEKKNHLYGVVMERARGVVIDALMYVGATVDDMLKFDKKHLKNQVKMRDPDLVMFQFGANEAYNNPGPKKLKKFISDYTQAINRARPEGTACLVVSLKDMGEKHHGRIRTRPGVPKILQATRKVASKTDCAFFNLFQALGGKGTMRRWRQTEPKLVSTDLGHLFDPGARKIGEVITEALEKGYESYLKK